MVDETTPAVVETPAPAPVEQKSPEMVTIEPKPEQVVTPQPTPEPEDPNKRLNELSRQRFEEKIRADNFEQQLRATKPAVATGERPKIENFDTLENYNKAIIEWAEQKGFEKATQQTTQAQEQRQMMQIRASVQAREVESRAKHADFDAVIAPLVPVIGSIPVLKQFIAESDTGTEVAYHLAKNPALLDELMRMTPFAAGRQLLTLESRLKAPPVSQSNAPEPIKPIGTRESNKPKLADLATKDINGYIARQNKAELERRKRAN